MTIAESSVGSSSQAGSSEVLPNSWLAVKLIFEHPDFKTWVHSTKNRTSQGVEKAKNLQDRMSGDILEGENHLPLLDTDFEHALHTYQNLGRKKSQ